jgi:hypothetical protein
MVTVGASPVAKLEGNIEQLGVVRSHRATSSMWFLGRAGARETTLLPMDSSKRCAARRIHVFEDSDEAIEAARLAGTTGTNVRLIFKC